MAESTLPTDPKAVQAHILRGIRRVLLSSGSSTRAELSRRLGLSFPTVGKFLARMEREGEIRPAGLDESSGGRRAVRYAYNPDYALCLTLFLERDETVYAVFDGLGATRETGCLPCATEEGEEGVFRLMEPLLARHPRVRSVAIGVPGSVEEGRIIYMPGYERFRDLDLRGRCEERFGIPAVVENDMNAAVLGYAEREGVPESESLVYLYRGRNGPGAGILIGGELVRGRSFFAGEVSFVPLDRERNFGQALETDGTASISRLVAALAAILNPHRVIFHREEVDPAMLDSIAAGSAAYIPAEHLPKLVCGDWREDYLRGLYRLGLELLLEA